MTRLWLRNSWNASETTPAELDLPHHYSFGFKPKDNDLPQPEHVLLSCIPTFHSLISQTWLCLTVCVSGPCSSTGKLPRRNWVLYTS